MPRLKSELHFLRKEYSHKTYLYPMSSSIVGRKSGGAVNYTGGAGKIR